MPSKMATCFREKAVLVAVYVERPRKRTPLSKSEQHHHHHHQHHHLHLHQAKNNGSTSRGGYNRRADLLNYSRRLRESARLVPPPPHHPKPIPSSMDDHHPLTQIIAVQSKPKHSRGPACLGNWKILIPSFLRSLTISQSRQERKKRKKKSSESASTKAKAIMKSFQVLKKGGFVSKVLATLQKYR